MRLHSKVVAVSFAFLLPFAAFADVYVICNSGITVGAADVADIFSGEKQTVGSTKLTPVDNKGPQNEFLQKALKSSKAKYDAAWAKKSFRDGINAPAVKGSDAEVIEAVKGAPGGIGYVSAAPGAGVTVVQKY